jgi:ATP-binding cassette subfamily B protein
VPLPADLKGKVEIRHLTFGYNPEHTILKDISFTIKPGERIAIVGPTGSGKTSLIRLLCRFYDVDPGEIFLDDVDIMQVAPSDIRRRIGVVLQDFHIFSGTVYDNIALGDPAITRGAAEHAAKLVHADPFIRALPQGYDTPLNERGRNLSHGQRQLLAFARVLAMNPEVLVLDEATASIDTETELVIQDALRKLTEGRTSIIIAHRLQTIKDAHRIVVLSEGKVREIGTHEELIAKGGMYNTLYELQFQEMNAG